MIKYQILNLLQNHCFYWSTNLKIHWDEEVWIVFIHFQLSIRIIARFPFIKYLPSLENKKTIRLWIWSEFLHLGNRGNLKWYISVSETWFFDFQMKENYPHQEAKKNYIPQATLTQTNLMRESVHVVWFYEKHERIKTSLSLRIELSWS
jgi:hypothetical protein